MVMGGILGEEVGGEDIRDQDIKGKHCHLGP